MDRELTDPEKGEGFRQYAEIGGYPEPLLKDVNRRDYLSTLLHSTLYKDIVARHRIRAPQGMDDLCNYLMSNVAQQYSYNTLARVTRLKSVHTVEKYLRHLEEAFLFFSLSRFSYKVRAQVTSPRKIYCIDNGLVTSVSFRFSADIGKLYENAVAVALHRRQLSGELQAFFWKSPQQEEVDFVVKEGLRVTRLIQVCARVEDPKTREREVRALLKASAELHCSDLTVLTDSFEETQEASWYGRQGTIHFMPLWKWLLEHG
jgi:predicted AAA+ superfamily ATPase